MIARPGSPTSRFTEADDLDLSLDAALVGNYAAGALGGSALFYSVLATAIASAALTAYGSFQSAQAQAGSMEYNAAVARAQAAYQQQAGEFEAGLLERQAAGTLALSEANAALGEAQAEAPISAGKVRADAIRRAYDKTQGEVNAAIGKSGVDTTGTPLLVLMANADTVGQELGISQYQTDLEVFTAKTGSVTAAYEGQQRAAALRGEATMRRFGAGAAASSLLGQAGMLRFGAGGVRTAGYIGAGNTLLTSAGQIGANYLRYGGKA
jgi:hypothetical protein